MAAYLVTAVLVEGQAVRAVAKDHGVSKTWPATKPRVRLVSSLAPNARITRPPRLPTASRTRSSGSERN
jgi:hypothetical protein